MKKTTRERILEAALKLFSTKGYLGATTKEIASTARVAELTLFRHFGSKEGLFEEVLANYSFLPVLKGLLPEVSGLPYEEALVKIAEKMLFVWGERKGMIRLMHTEAVRYPDKIHQIFNSFLFEMVKTLASYFDGLMAQGRLRKFDSLFAARAFLGMFYSYFNVQEIMQLKKYHPNDSEAVVRQFVSIFVRGTIAEKTRKRRSG